MVLTLAIIFAFMVFMIILRNGQLLFVGISSLLIIAAISFGIGYGIANFLVFVGGPILKFIGIAIAIIVTLVLVTSFVGNGGE